MAWGSIDFSLVLLCYGAQQRDESGEMYSPDNQGEYMPKSGTHNISIKGLSDALMALESEVMVV